MHTCEEYNEIIKLEYMASKDNIIADAISRGNWTEAQKRVSKRGWSLYRLDLSMHMNEWELHFLPSNTRMKH